MIVEATPGALAFQKGLVLRRRLCFYLLYDIPSFSGTGSLTFSERTGVTTSYKFFDTIGDAADGCEASCGAADNRVCNTCSAAAASACSSVMCNAIFFYTNEDCR